MASWFWDVLKVGSGEAGDFTQAEERRELRSQQERLASGQRSCSHLSTPLPVPASSHSLLPLHHVCLS